MADVYFSYSRQDDERIGPLVRALREAGVSITTFEDSTVANSFEESIELAIQGAKCVVVLWSEASVRSPSVFHEAALAKTLNKLIPFRVDAVPLPLGFGSIVTADLFGENGSLDLAKLPYAVSAVRRAIERNDAGLPPPETSDETTVVHSGVGELPVPGSKVRPNRNRPFSRPRGASNTIVFVAHASVDKPRIAPIVATLLNSGFCVWIDKPHLLELDQKQAKRLRGIEYGGGDWREQICRSVARARVVLALWSDEAVDLRREQFHYEIYMGLVQGKLVQAKLDDLPGKIGMPFTFDQIADLTNFESGAYHAELDYMLSGFPKFRRRLL